MKVIRVMDNKEILMEGEGLRLVRESRVIYTVRGDILPLDSEETEEIVFEKFWSKDEAQWYYNKLVLKLKQTREGKL